MHSSGPCLHNSLHNHVAVVNGRGREFGTRRRDIGRENEWQCTLDDSGVILLIQALISAKIANTWVINCHSHSDLAPNI